MYMPFCSEYRHINFDEEFINSEDSVKEQYKKLPYPVFTKDDLERESQYYDSKKDVVPRVSSNANNLESLNHFLFQRKENFR